jgi:NAD(P)-dependent dehydrogenase (short-subunit alcohol dehydrogenase family)
MAIEGFTGLLAHELESFNLRVKLVEPGWYSGTIQTRVEAADRSLAQPKKRRPEASVPP